MNLALAYPGTPIGWWLEQDDQVIATALAILEERRS